MICVKIQKHLKRLAFELSEENKKELLVPAGCGHGYLVLKHSIVSYKCAEKFYGEYDDGIVWNDSDLAIQWPTELVEKNYTIRKG